MTLLSGDGDAELRRSLIIQRNIPRITLNVYKPFNTNSHDDIIRDMLHYSRIDRAGDHHIRRKMKKAKKKRLVHFLIII